MTNERKQQIINEVTNHFRNKQWFNGAGFTEDTLIVAYNYYPAFELAAIKTKLLPYGNSYELKDIRNILPNAQKDDVPPYVR